MYEIDNKNNELNVYVNGVMSDETCTAIVNEIKLAKESVIKNITIHINSYGGSVKGCWDIISTIRDNGMYFTAINEGFAFSAAAVLLASADKAYAYDYSSAMIHDPLLGGKTLKETKGKDRTLLQSIKDGIMTILGKRLKVSTDILSKMLADETSLNSDEQLQYGLVDEIYAGRKTKKYEDSMDVMEICNIYAEFNKNNNKEIENNMNEEIENVDSVNIENDTQEIVENAVDDVIVEDANTDEISNQLVEMTNQLTILKIENFILKNKMENRSEDINNAVEKHGVEVLDTILTFIKNDTSVELENKVENLENKIVSIVNETNDSIEDILNDSGQIDYEAKAEQIFGLNGDEDARLEMKVENPELYEKLKNIYFEI